MTTLENMQQKEFEDLTWEKVSGEDYAGIEAMYMAAGEMPKEEFCEHWRRVGRNPLTLALLDRVKSLAKKLDVIIKQEQKARVQLLEMAHVALNYAARDNNSAAVDRATEILGAKEAAIYKLENGLKISDKDRSVIVATLREATYEEIIARDRASRL